MLGRYIDLGNPVSDHPSNKGLVSWWLPLPGLRYGYTFSDLVQNNPLAVTGTFSWSEWRNGFGAFRTNPTTSTSADGYAITTSPKYTDSLRSAFTLSVWTYGAPENAWPQLSGSILHVMSYFNGARTCAIGGSNLSSPQSMYVYVDNNAASVSVDWTAYSSVWRHIAATYDKTTLRLYIDGQEVGSTSYSATLEGPSDYIVLGATSYTPDGWAGDITDARILSRACSASEIYSVLYEGSLRGHPDTLRRYSLRTYSFGSSPAAAAASMVHLALRRARNRSLVRR